MSDESPQLPRQSRLVSWIFLLLVTLVNSALALPTNRATLGSRDNNDTGVMGSDPGTDDSGSDTAGTGPDTSTTDGSSGSDSMSTLSSEPVTVQLGAGFIIGCVLGVVGYAIVKLTMKTIRGGMSIRAERRERWRGRPDPDPDEDQTAWAEV